LQERGKRDVQKGIAQGITQRKLQSVKPGYKLRFQIVLHSVREKEEIPFKTK
jgi:hypothetical protein